MSLFKLPLPDPHANKYAARLADKLASRPVQFLGALPDEILLDEDIPDSSGPLVLVWSSDPWKNWELKRVRMKRQRANECAAYIQACVLRWLYLPEGPMVRRAVRELALDAVDGDRGGWVEGGDEAERRVPPGADDVPAEPRADGEGAVPCVQADGG